ncbi:MAG: aminotransferase class IV [Nitrospinae bacterium]|nr:aminotransferase class IV [Nitrospinota bacterium]
MPEFYSHNGKIVERSSCALSPFDRSFMLGDGLFETVLVRGGVAVWLREHYERMKGSAAFFGIAFPFAFDDVAEWSARLIEAEGVQHGFLRIALSRGTSQTGRFADLPDDTRMAIIAGNSAPRAEMPIITAAIAPWPVNERDPAVRHKTASRIGAVYAKARAGEMGVDELLFCNTQGAVAEGIYSNIFWMKDQELYTPSAECGILAGIARAKVLAAARKLGVKTNVGAYGIDAPRGAEELFFTNSLMVISRCGAFDGVAKDANRIMAALEQLIFSEL